MTDVHDWVTDHWIQNLPGIPDSARGYFVCFAEIRNAWESCVNGPWLLALALARAGDEATRAQVRAVAADIVKELRTLFDSYVQEKLSARNPGRLAYEDAKAEIRQAVGSVHIPMLGDELVDGERVAYDHTLRAIRRITADLVRERLSAPSGRASADPAFEDTRRVATADVSAGGLYAAAMNADKNAASVDLGRFERKLGIPLGTTLTELLRLVHRIDPEKPHSALSALCFEMPWLAEDTTVDELRRGMPENVLPFARTGASGNLFGFLMDDPQAPTDARPIVLIKPLDGADGAHIVAPSLADLLALLTLGDGDMITRRLSDEAWRAYRGRTYGADPARLAIMEKLSDMLCMLTGVWRPSSPSELANRTPDQHFTIAR